MQNIATGITKGVSNGGKAVKSLFTRGCHSFAPTTPVLMADGSVKPIAEVAEGDVVVSTDPETGETADEPVVELHVNHDTELTNLTVWTSDSGPTTLHTTQNHPFWSINRQNWIDAKDLLPRERLQTSDGAVVVVLLAHSFVGSRVMHDLTVDRIHTYYVLAGNTPVLVHNCPNEVPAAAARRPSFRKSTERDALEVAPRAADGGPACPGCGTEIGRGKIEYGGRMRRDFDLDHYNGTWAERKSQMPSDISRPDVIDIYQQDVRATCPLCNQSHILEGR